MLDDYRFSIGRVVVYKHPDPSLPKRAYGQKGPDRTVGIIIGVEPADSPQPQWIYTIKNIRTRETVRVPESEIAFGSSIDYSEFRGASRIPTSGADRMTGRIVAEALSKAITESTVTNYLRSSVHDILRAEKAEEITRREGRDLPLDVGDYLRIRGDLRSETKDFHNLYAKILAVKPPDRDYIDVNVRGIGRQYRVRRRYLVQADNSERIEIYDPEIKVFYTIHGRKQILNWRAVTFLAEVFGDDAPYSVEMDYVQNHVYTRSELDLKDRDELQDLLSSVLYAKGHMGWYDYEDRRRLFKGVSKGFLIDTILAASRFDMHRNRLMTPEEINLKIRDRERLKKLIG